MILYLYFIDARILSSVSRLDFCAFKDTLQVLAFWYHPNTNLCFRFTPSVDNFHGTQILGLSYPGLRIHWLNLQKLSCATCSLMGLFMPI